MIDNKKIEAAKEEIYEDRFLLNGEEVVFDNDATEEMFYKEDIKEAIELGAKWAINELLKDLWHPASEEPKASPHDEYGFVHTEDVIQLIVVTRNDETKFMYSTHQEEYDGDKEGYWLLYDEDANEYDPSEGDIKKWAYLDDLFPKEGGNHD